MACHGGPPAVNRRPADAPPILAYIRAMQPLLSRPFRLGQLGAQPRQEAVEADAAECASLAQAYDLPGIARLRGVFTLTREAGGIIAAELLLSARLTQICVVTLEPFDSDVADHAALRFVPAAAIGESEAGEVGLELADGDLDAPDELPYVGETIDLGAALAEQLALALDPYPRKPGAELPANAADEAPHPFAALAARRPRN